MAVGLSSKFVLYTYIYGWFQYITCMALLSNVKHDCKTVGIHMGWGERGGLLIGISLPGVWSQTKGVGVTNVPWDHLSGPTLT